REASLDRASIHISLDDGIIAFTESVAGHITGAFFQGDGEILLTPPNSVERSSLAMFTGGAILEEKFSTAYFRFNDDVYAELTPFLRTADDTDAFVSRWKDSVRDLSDDDALRQRARAREQPPILTSTFPISKFRPKSLRRKICTQRRFSVS